MMDFSRSGQKIRIDGNHPPRFSYAIWRMRSHGAPATSGPQASLLLRAAEVIQ
jgi:hypothetical protein